MPFRFSYAESGKISEACAFPKIPAGYFVSAGRKQPVSLFIFGGILLFLLLLFGGVTVKQNYLSPGVISCQAITVNHPPAKEKLEGKSHKTYNRLMKWIKSGHYDSKLGTAVVLLLGGLILASISFGIWSVILLVAAKYGAGILVGILCLASLFGLYKFLSP